MLRILGVLVLILAAMPAWAADGDVPESLQGRWVDQGETCAPGGPAMTVSATTLVYADGRIDDVVFSARENVFRIREEATAYEYVEAGDKLLFRPEGFGMGSAFPMLRCPEPTGTLERRCGWLANLTNGNWWLVDADRTWTLSAQGDDSSDVTAVMDMVPSFDPAEFVATGTHQGYGCACMTVATDIGTGRVVAIAGSKRLPLATCQTDKALPAPGAW